MKFRNIFLVSTAVLFCTASITATSIEHTFVSRSGVDTNPCNATSPCLTFTGALAKTSVGGMITAEDAGDFGSVNIAQSVTIDGSNLGGISFTSGTGINITSSANVTVQNLTINGMASGAYGIWVTNGGFLTVHNCQIMNFTERAVYFEGPGNLTVENTRIESFGGTGAWGIYISSNAAQNVVVKNTLIDASPLSASNFGFVVYQGSGPVKTSLQNVTIRGAGYAALLDSGVTQITGSVFTQSGYGVFAQLAATVSVANSQISANTTGVCSKSKIRLDTNDIFDNTTAIGNCSGSVVTSTTNKTSGTIAIPAGNVTDIVTF